MNSRCISVMVLLMLILICPGFAGQTNEPDAQPSGADAAQITTLALDAMNSQPSSTRPTEWPITSADILAGYRPYNKWPDAERWFMLTALEKAAQKTPAIGEWLHGERPLQKAHLRFEVQSMLGIGSQFGTVSQEAWNEGPLTEEQLGKFIGSLSSTQKTKLLTSNLRLPISELTPAQKEVISSIFKDMPSVNQTTAMNLPDAYLYFRFQFYVSAQIQGSSKTFEALVSSL